MMAERDYYLGMGPNAGTILLRGDEDDLNTVAIWWSKKAGVEEKLRLLQHRLDVLERRHGRLLAAAQRVVDDLGACEVDREGYCQAHGLGSDDEGRPLCVVAELRTAVGDLVNSGGGGSNE